MLHNHKILFVDDERHFSEMTQEYLMSKGLKVILEHSSEKALLTFKQSKFDLCILDIKMPFKDGFALAAEIREFNNHIPIIFLTGQIKKEDRIKGLSLGADDYITKPFSMEELYLRIKNIVKRTKIEQITRREVEKYNIASYHFDPASRELSKDSKSIRLTAIESKLLKLFCENINEIVERDLALKRIWGDDDLLRGRSLNVYVSKLRTFLQEDERILFLNVHGYGYKMTVKED